MVEKVGIFETVEVAEATGGMGNNGWSIRKGSEIIESIEATEVAENSGNGRKSLRCLRLLLKGLNSWPGDTHGMVEKVDVVENVQMV